MRALLVSIILFAACSGAPARPASVPASSSELSPALEPLAWLLGDWTGDAGAEHWIAANGAIYGVSLPSGGWEVIIIDDGEGTAPADGVLRFIAMPGGARSVEFRGDKVGDRSVTFANPAHDDPKAITYARDAAGLRATLHGANEMTFTFRATTRAAAPELEAADRAFAADTAKRGIEGWMAAFDPAGGMMRKGARVEGDAIREMMGPLLAGGTLAWDPIASGRADKIGFTVGKATFTGATPDKSWESSYVTIWRQQLDGSWKVLFDVGRPKNR